MVDLEDELFAFRYQWSEMLRNNAAQHSSDEVVGMTPGACVTDNKGLYDKKQHAVTHSQGGRSAVFDIACPALKEGL